VSWQALKDGNKELAEFGLQRFSSQVAYLATVRKDGSPRVHPLTPIVEEGRLFVFMEPTSPKGHDLRRDSRYAMHASVEDNYGGDGEFFITGRARLVDDANVRAIAAKHLSYTTERYILFELSVASAFSKVYTEVGPPICQRWKQD
jgi:general stress protein 26